MKCPKCGYLGFETTERCRNCGYDFSLAAPSVPRELPLRAPVSDAPLDELELRAPAEGRAPAPSPVAAPPPAESSAPLLNPAEDLPLFAPRPAGTPLAVRRAGAEVPRARRTTTRLTRAEAPALPLVLESAEAAVPAIVPHQPPRARAVETASPGARLMAGVIDIVTLGGIDLLTVWLTLRIAGLEQTSDDLALIRTAPMAAFFLVLAFLYLVGFTLGGGQTIGKMAMSIRVTGDDGLGVDLTGAVVRALGSLLCIGTLGLLFVPVFLGTERRAVHDRLAGTRVVTG